MTNNLNSFLETLDRLPEEDIRKTADALAGYFVSATIAQGPEKGLLTTDSSQQRSLKARIGQSIVGGFKDRLARTITESPFVPAQINALVNPYALGVINRIDNSGFRSDLVVASDPQMVDFQTALNKQKFGEKDVQPYLRQLPPRRGLRSENGQLWVGTELTRSEHISAQGGSERSFVPGYYIGYARTMDSMTLEISEKSASEKLLFVPTVLVPLATVRAFQGY